MTPNTKTHEFDDKSSLKLYQFSKSSSPLRNIINKINKLGILIVSRIFYSEISQRTFDQLTMIHLFFLWTASNFCLCRWYSSKKMRLDIKKTILWFFSPSLRFQLFNFQVFVIDFLTFPDITTQDRTTKNKLFTVLHFVEQDTNLNWNIFDFLSS